MKIFVLALLSLLFVACRSQKNENNIDQNLTFQIDANVTYKVKDDLSKSIETIKQRINLIGELISFEVIEEENHSCKIKLIFTSSKISESKYATYLIERKGDFSSWLPLDKNWQEELISIFAEDSLDIDKYLLLGKSSPNVGWSQEKDTSLVRKQIVNSNLFFELSNVSIYWSNELHCVDKIFLGYFQDLSVIQDKLNSGAFFKTNVSGAINFNQHVIYEALAIQDNNEEFKVETESLEDLKSEVDKQLKKLKSDNLGLKTKIQLSKKIYGFELYILDAESKVIYNVMTASEPKLNKSYPDDEWNIIVQLNSNEVDDWALLTDSRQGKSIALGIDELVYSVPVIFSKISSGTTMIHCYSKEEAYLTAAILNAGILEVDLIVLKSKVL